MFKKAFDHIKFLTGLGVGIILTSMALASDRAYENSFTTFLIGIVIFGTALVLRWISARRAIKVSKKENLKRLFKIGRAHV